MDPCLAPVPKVYDGIINVFEYSTHPRCTDLEQLLLCLTASHSNRIDDISDSLKLITLWASILKIGHKMSVYYKAGFIHLLSVCFYLNMCENICFWKLKRIHNIQDKAYCFIHFYKFSETSLFFFKIIKPIWFCFHFYCQVSVSHYLNEQLMCLNNLLTWPLSGKIYCFDKSVPCVSILTQEYCLVDHIHV